MTAQLQDKQQQEEQGLPWRLNERELVSSLLKDSEKSQSEKYKLVADVQDVIAKADRKGVQLFEVTEVLGYSGWSWCPMMWKLRLVVEIGDCIDPRSQRRWTFRPADYFVY
jgi:hypothetical protein